MMDQQNQSTARPRSHTDRIGISISATDPRHAVEIIQQAEGTGVRQIWMTQSPGSLDALTVYAAAMVQTTRVRLGTSIVPTYPRHPLALAQQAGTVAALGAARLRLGIGPSHRPTIEGTYGLPMEAPLSHTQEYLGILRAILWEGKVDHQGQFFTARTQRQDTPCVPLLLSALGRGAFHLAGAISDGAISWNCPPSYLHTVALPAMQAGAIAAGRPCPPLVAHTWVALSTDSEAVRTAARQRLSGYARLPFYANMFAAAGFPIGDGGVVSDALIDSLVVMGSEEAITAQLSDLLDNGLDELLLTSIPLGDEVQERDRLFRLVGRLP